METKKVLLRIILLATVLISVAHLKGVENCPKLTPAAIKDANVCAQKTAVDPVLNVATYNIQQCPLGTVCNFVYRDENSADGTCIPAVISGNFYPGDHCDSDNDCIYFSLDKTSGCGANKKCNGELQKNDKCSIDRIACAFKLTCLEDPKDNTNFICSEPKKATEVCKRSSDCERTSGCLDGVCTPYFSKATGSKLTNTDDELLSSGLSFCVSGFSDSNGVCKDYVPKNKDCTSDKDCTDDQDIIDVCECGYFDGKGKCKVATNDDSYTLFVRTAKKDLAVLDKCNAHERRPKCAHYLKDPSIHEFNRVDDLEFKIWKVNNINKLPASIAPQDVFTYRNTTTQNHYSATPSIDPPTADPHANTKVSDKMCAAFTCPDAPKDKSKLCAEHVVNNGKDVVELYDQCDKDLEMCGDYSQYFKLPVVPTTLLCQPKSFNNAIKYPEEACTSNGQCDSGKCTNGVCEFPGNKDGKTCTTSKDCGIGKFCSANTCTDLLSTSAQSCSNTFECQMNLVCFNNKCVSPYSSVDIGTKSQLENGVDPSYFCKTGRYDPITGNCYKLITKGTPESSGLVKCKIGHNDCNYGASGIDGVNTNRNIVEECQCGFNADGQAYCPLGDDQSNLFN